MTTKHAILLGLTFSSTAFLLPRDAGAGAFSNHVSCTAFKGGGTCTGTLRAFRRARDPEAFAAFSDIGSSTEGPPRQFTARLDDFYGSCDIPESVSEEMWTRLTTNPDLVFHITWSAPDYDCVFVVVSADSRTVDVPALLLR